MASESGTRAGVLVLRAWQEGDAADTFRARIIGTLDVERPGEVVERATASEDDACAAVADWLAAFVGSSATRRGS